MAGELVLSSLRQATIQNPIDIKQAEQQLQQWEVGYFETDFSFQFVLCHICS